MNAIQETAKIEGFGGFGCGCTHTNAEKNTLSTLCIGIGIEIIKSLPCTHDKFSGMYGVGNSQNPQNLCIRQENRCNGRL